MKNTGSSPETQHARLPFPPAACASLGHSTNLAKLYRKAALTCNSSDSARASAARAVDASEAPTARPVTSGNRQQVTDMVCFPRWIGFAIYLCHLELRHAQGSRLETTRVAERWDAILSRT